jgi:hypothetical protein
VKVNPREGLARTLIPWIIEHAKIALDRPYWDSLPHWCMTT